MNLLEYYCQNSKKCFNCGAYNLESPARYFLFYCNLCNYALKSWNSDIPYETKFPKNYSDNSSQIEGYYSILNVEYSQSKDKDYYSFNVKYSLIQTLKIKNNKKIFGYKNFIYYIEEDKVKTIELKNIFDVSDNFDNLFADLVFK